MSELRVSSSPWLHPESKPRMLAYGQRTTALERVIWTILIVVLVWWLISQMIHAHEIRTELRAVDETLQKLASVKKGTTQERVPSPRWSEQEVRELNRIVAQLNIPWQDILLTLEKTTPAEVAIIALEPQAGVASMRVTAESRSLERLMAYAASLREQGVFGALSFRKHETNAQDPNTPVRLTFDLEIRARTPSPVMAASEARP